MAGNIGIRTSSYGSLDKQIFSVQQLLHQQNGGSGGGGGGPLLSFQTPVRIKQGKPFKEKDSVFLWICKSAGSRKVGMMLLCLVSLVVFIWVLYMGKGNVARESDRVSSIQFNGTRFNGFASRPSIDHLDFPPPPPAYFLGYSLPPGHPCNSFSLPPPPADRKRVGPRSCPVCYLPVEEAIALMPMAPSYSPVVKNLAYIHENPLSRNGEFGGSDFGGYPTLAQRSDSFDVRKSMSVHCGFFRGEKPGRSTGFDVDEIDMAAMDECCGVVVASAIFGAFDIIQQPSNISNYSKNTVCFFMFVDEETEEYLKKNGDVDNDRKVGVWRIVVVHNLPYTDGRRNGKVPKLLTHRMFPNARYSIWIDGKLELVVDPYQILERHLWRKNATFAISRHYRRFDTFVEAEANKAAAKYDNASIDFQIDFYRKEGLTPYSEAKLPITSDVPEGCVIIREHVPISNLFTCLWFNEVDRFTSRDQISFSTVRDKIHAKTNWSLNMFFDCERRNFVVQKYHREALEHMAPPPPANAPPPPLLPSPPPPNSTQESINRGAGSPARRSITRRVRRSHGRRHRKVAAGRENDTN